MWGPHHEAQGAAGTPTDPSQAPSPSITADRGSLSPTVRPARASSGYPALSMMPLFQRSEGRGDDKQRSEFVYRRKSPSARVTAPCAATVRTPWPVSASTRVLSAPGNVLTVPGWYATKVIPSANRKAWSPGRSGRASMALRSSGRRLLG
jgi:hypothetical protein